MKKLFALLPTLLLVVALLAPNALGRIWLMGVTIGQEPATGPTPTYYVDSSISGYNGSSAPSGACATADAGAGTSDSAPLCTMAAISGKQATFGADTRIGLKAGDVWNEALTITHMHGTEGHPVFWTRYGAGADPIIDGQSTRDYGVVAHSVTASWLTFDHLTVRNNKVAAFSFWAWLGSMPGITVQNSYIHDNGAGAYPGDTRGPIETGGDPTVCTNSPPSGAGRCDPGGYVNSGFDFQDSVMAVPTNGGPRVLNNVFSNNGGHNTINIHYNNQNNTLEQGNVITGCDHGCIDNKGVGNINSRAVIDTNVLSTEAPSWSQAPCIYVMDEHNPETYVTISRNVCYGSKVGIQVGLGIDESYPCTVAACHINAQVYYNTVVASNTPGINSYAFYGGGDSTYDSWVTIDAAYNIWDGGQVTKHSYGLNWTGHHNNRGGYQGNTLGNDTPIGAGDVSNQNPGYANFAGNDFHTTDYGMGAYANLPVPTSTPTVTPTPTPTPTATPTPLWAANAEGGNTSEFSSVSGATAQNSIFDYADTGGAWAFSFPSNGNWAYSGMGLAQATLYIREYLRLTAGTPITGNDSVMRVVNGGGSPIGYIRWAATLGNSSTYTLGLYNKQSGSFVQIGSSSAALNYDQWYKVEMRATTSPTHTEGVLQMRIGGTTVATGTGLDTGTGTWDKVLFGPAEGTGSTAGIPQYLDDPVIRSDGYP